MSIGEYTASSWLLTAAADVMKDEGSCFSKKTVMGALFGVGLGVAARIISAVAIVASAIEFVVATPIQLLRTVVQIGIGKGDDKLERIASSCKDVALRALGAPIASALSIAVPEVALGTYKLHEKLVFFGIDDVVQRVWWKHSPIARSASEGIVIGDKISRRSVAHLAFKKFLHDPGATDNVSAAYFSCLVSPETELHEKIEAWATAAAETNLSLGSSEEIFFKFVGAMKLETQASDRTQAGLWEANLFIVLRDFVHLDGDRLVFSPCGQDNPPHLPIEGWCKNDLIKLKKEIDEQTAAKPVNVHKQVDDLHRTLKGVVTKFRFSPIGRQIWDAVNEAGLHLPRGLVAE